MADAVVTQVVEGRSELTADEIAALFKVPQMGRSGRALLTTQPDEDPLSQGAHVPSFP